MDPNDSNMKLLLDARCTENLPSGAFLVLKSLLGEVFLYREGGIHSVLNAVSEMVFTFGGGTTTPPVLYYSIRWRGIVSFIP
jgi:hypothetical protein